ncbi:MAG: sporulation initiation factor Spo0A C-terminal domain-containing protein [Ruminococcus sp.]|nr:sporulation initiation factor Spo0A C-terminal domain-containing protein [Ruminococcus sp.]
MESYKLFIQGQSAKCAEIASELYAGGIKAVMIADLPQEITAEPCAVIIDNSNDKNSDKLSLDIAETTKVFVLTNAENSPISDENGVTYIPVNTHTRSIVTYVRNSIGAVANLRKTIARFLMKMGVLAHLKGFQYLVEAVLLLIENPLFIGRFKVDVYPKIAKKMNTSDIAVERNIRTLILKTYESHEVGYFNKYFNYSVQNPSNTEFIIWCAEKIKADIL